MPLCQRLRRSETNKPPKDNTVQQNDVEAAFIRIVEGVANMRGAAVASGKRLREDLGIDSLSLIDVAIAIEDAFNIRIPDEDLERFQTITDAVEYIRRATAVAGIPLVR